MNKVFLLFICALLLSKPSSLSQSPVHSLIDSLEDILQNKKIPGAMLSVVNRDSVIYAGGVGVANIEDSIAVSDQHLFRLGSISKTMTCLAIMKLVSENTLSLQTPVVEIDSELPIKNKWSEQSPILVEHLLEHTAGFDDMHFHAIYNEDDEKRPTCREMIDTHAKSLYARWEPGTLTSYSNPGYVVAGHVIEKITGRPFDEYIKTEILNPIGMKHSGFYFKEPTHAPMAKGYEHEGGKYIAIEYPSIQGGPAGELCSNAEDMSRFIRFMLQKGKTEDGQQLIPLALFERMESAHTTLAATQGLPGGYGLAISNSWRFGHAALGHNGGIDGFVSDYIYVPSADLAIAVSVNTNKRTRDVMNAIGNHFINQVEIKRSDRSTVPIAMELAKEYQGYYTYINPRNQLFGFIEKMITGVSLKFEQDSVVIKDLLGNQIDTWYHVGDNQFCTGTEEVPFSMLLKHNGHSAIWVDGGYGIKESKTVRWIKNLVFGLAIITTVLCFIFGFFYLLYKVVSKHNSPQLGAIAMWLSSLSFVAMLASFIFSMESVESIANPHISSVLTFVSSILFLLFSLFALFIVIKYPSNSRFRTGAKIFITVLMAGLALFLLQEGIIGLRLWAY